MTVNDQMTLEDASMPKLPDTYRSMPVLQVVLWVWVVTTTLLLISALAFGAYAWSALEKTGAAVGPFVVESGCSAYWSFVLDAKRAGIDVEQLGKMYDRLGVTGHYAATQTCGSIADVYATMP